MGSSVICTMFEKRYDWGVGEQDARNAVLDCTTAQISVIGQDDMDFIPRGYILLHAKGRPKSQDKGYVREAMRNFPTTLLDKHYWRVSAPLETHPLLARLRARIGLKLSSAIGGLYQWN